MNGLVSHLHRIHGNKSHECKICIKSFDRKNSLVRHSKTRNKHPMTVYDTNTINLINTYESYKWSTPTPSERVCSWCGEKKKLLQNKNYCFECSMKSRKCNHCHCLMPEMHFSSMEDSVCKTCHTESEKARLKAVESVLPTDGQDFFDWVDSRNFVSYLIQNKHICSIGVALWRSQTLCYLSGY